MGQITQFKFQQYCGESAESSKSIAMCNIIRPICQYSSTILLHRVSLGVTFCYNAYRPTCLYTRLVRIIQFKVIDYWLFLGMSGCKMARLQCQFNFTPRVTLLKNSHSLIIRRIFFEIFNPIGFGSPPHSIFCGENVLLLAHRSFCVLPDCSPIQIPTFNSNSSSIARVQRRFVFRIINEQ